MDRWVGRSAWASALSLVLVGATARAGDPPAQRSILVRLVYVRRAGAEHCPEPDALRAAVAARLGYEPFQDDAKTVVTATLSRQGRLLRAVIELRDASGALTGSREISSQENDCAELASAAALAISIAVDPKSAMRSAREARRPPPPPPEPSAGAPPPVPAAPEQKPPPPAPERPDPVFFRAGLDALGVLGAAPKPAFGALLHAGVRWRALSVALEGRADAPAGIPVADGRVSASLFLGTIAACFHSWALVACGLVSAGALSGSNEGATASTHATTPFVSLGGRFGVEVHLIRGLYARGHFDLLGTATRTTLDVDGVPVWRTPPLDGALGAGLLWSFP
jgi:hypothetical protein